MYLLADDLTTTSSGRQTSPTPSSCPHSWLLYMGLAVSQQHTAEPVSNAAAPFSCIPCHNFNEGLQTRDCIEGDGADGLTWCTSRNPSAFQGWHNTPAGNSIAIFHGTPLATPRSQNKHWVLLLFFLSSPQALPSLHTSGQVCNPHSKMNSCEHIKQTPLSPYANCSFRSRGKHVPSSCK